MKRTNHPTLITPNPEHKAPDLILTSDWHLREDTPPCRTDDFQEAQWKKVGMINHWQQVWGVPVVHAGDLFHHWKPSPWLISKAIQELPVRFMTVAGQHDLPQHSLDLLDKSGIYAVWVAGACEFRDKQGNWGQEPGGIGRIRGMNVAVWHHFVWDGKELPWPGCEEVTARKVLKKYPQYDLIITGDHHKPFTYEYEGRLLVNPGCLTRQVADYANHKPRVYFWYAETNTVVPQYLDVKDVVSREHIEVKAERDKRIDAFISRLSDTYEVGLSFEENLRRFFGANTIKRSVIDIINRSLE